VSDPYDTHTLHVWGEAREDSGHTPDYQGDVYDFLPFLDGNPGITDPEWSEEDGVTYFNGPGENGNPKSWDLSWNADWMQPPAAKPKVKGTGPARGTGSIPGGVTGGGMGHQEMADLVNG